MDKFYMSMFVYVLESRRLEMKYIVNYIMNGSIEVEAENEAEAERAIKEIISTEDIINGLSTDGDDIDITSFISLVPGNIHLVKK